MRAIWKKEQKEGLVVSFDTGPEWANWKSLFRDFKKRYPDVEMTYNALGSAATVVALDDMVVWGISTQALKFLWQLSQLVMTTPVRVW